MNALLRVLCVGTKILALLGVSFMASSQTVLPTVPVTAPATSGPNIICTGYECAGVIAQLQAEHNQELLDQQLPMEPDPPVDREEMCERLEGVQPSGCSAGSPPPTPVFGNGWAPNGCGTAHWSTDIVDALIAVPFPVPNGTSLENPAVDVYFGDACNSHDACYGSGLGRSSCDAAFANDVATACSSSLNPLCGSYASAYSSAVETFGGGPYAGAAEALICASWNHDMETNACD